MVYKMTASATTLTPSEAREPTNALDVNIKLELHRRHERKYPTIDIGEIYKKRDKFDKEHKTVWLSRKHEVLDFTKQ